MILQVFSVYDSKAGAFAAPFFCTTLGLARRAFIDAANTPEHPLSKNSADFTLFHLGTFDDEHAVFVLLPEHRNLGLASNFKQEVTNNVRQIA